MRDKGGVGLILAVISGLILFFLGLKFAYTFGGAGGVVVLFPLWSWKCYKENFGFFVWGNSLAVLIGLVVISYLLVNPLPFKVPLIRVGVSSWNVLQSYLFLQPFLLIALPGMLLFDQRLKAPVELGGENNSEWKLARMLPWLYFSIPFFPGVIHSWFVQSTEQVILLLLGICCLSLLLFLFGLSTSKFDLSPFANSELEKHPFFQWINMPQVLMPFLAQASLVYFLEIIRGKVLFGFLIIALSGLFVLTINRQTEILFGNSSGIRKPLPRMEKILLRYFLLMTSLILLSGLFEAINHHLRAGG